MNVIRGEGVRGLYRGFGITVMREVRLRPLRTLDFNVADPSPRFHSHQSNFLYTKSSNDVSPSVYPAACRRMKLLHADH
jgi:hypothetical protein